MQLELPDKDIFRQKGEFFNEIPQTLTEPRLANFRSTIFKIAPLDAEIFIPSLLGAALEYSRWWSALTSSHEGLMAFSSVFLV